MAIAAEEALACWHNPRTGRLGGQVWALRPERAGEIAMRAQEIAPFWATQGSADRLGCLEQLASALDNREATMAARLSEQSGKSPTEAETELQRAAATMHWLAGAGARLGLPQELEGDGLKSVVHLEPVGPVLCVVPATYPALIFARKAGAALAMGCPVVVAGPPSASAVLLELVAMARAAGFHEDVLQVAITEPAGSAALVARPEFRLVSFTGSARVGRLVAAAAAANIVECILELGGHTPVIVTDDADVAMAADEISRAKWHFAGQSCAAPSRVIAHAAVYEQLVGHLLEHRPMLEVEGGLLGPLQTERRLHEVTALVCDAVDAGATVLAGGAPVDHAGNWYPATILADVPTRARILSEEPFGPVLLAQRYLDDAEAVRMANANPFGLGAAVFARRERGQDLASQLNAGRVSLNCLTGADPQSPLVGRGHSGYGYEGGLEGLRAFTRTKVLQARLPARSPAVPEGGPRRSAGARQDGASGGQEGGRLGRIAAHKRNPKWRLPPRRIEPSECIGCDSCLRSCPPQLGAVYNLGLDVVILPELCNGCGKCVQVCPVDCIYVAPDWRPTPEVLWTHVAGQELYRPGRRQ